DSFFVNGHIPLRSADKTSTYLHELFHVWQPFRPKADGRWISEGLAEYYSLALQHRAGRLSDRSFARGIRLFARYARWGVDRARTMGSRMRSSRLIVVSNRAPLEMVRGPQGVRALRTVGGLAAALDDALRVHGGTWIAWVGQHAHDELRPETTGLAYPIRAVRLKEREVSHYYAGFSNQVLWPLCHMFPSRCRIQQSYWTAYRAANERFAAVVQASVAPGDLVWHHDLHLCLVPGLLRAAGVRARLGVFWHIPFPPPTVFGILRWREELLGGLLGADLLGFQTDADVRNFLASVRQYLDVPVVDDP